MINCILYSNIDEISKETALFGVSDYMDHICLDIEENEISSKIESMAVSGSGTSASSSTVSDDSDMDEFFADAGRLIVESGKCSIGMLQRKFKIGFNRAARIMDALSECGVVGPEEGTKARAILMTHEEFESFVSTL